MRTAATTSADRGVFVFLNIEKIIVWSGLLCSLLYTPPCARCSLTTWQSWWRASTGTLSPSTSWPPGCPQQHQEHLLQTPRPGRHEGHQAQGHWPDDQEEAGRDDDDFHSQRCRVLQRRSLPVTFLDSKIIIWNIRWNLNIPSSFSLYKGRHISILFCVTKQSICKFVSIINCV